jgi:2-aminoethylphosphonate-pyruvate transaminase
MNIKKFVQRQNAKKKLFTPGPASLLKENIMGLAPCFGRGDDGYKKIEKRVLNYLKKIPAHKSIVTLQGSASLALEILIHNFLYGNVLVVDTGIYSDRIKLISTFSKKTFKNIKNIRSINWKQINEFSGRFDWIFACPTETSIGLKVPMQDLYKLKKRCNAKLALDATASIGLEKDHSFCDVMAYSSCKGLFGLTGGSFISYNIKPNNLIESFYLNINSHAEHKMTGPYHTILSLEKVISSYNEFKYAVIVNKKRIMRMMSENIQYPKKNQPLLCTYISKKLFSKDKRQILYKTRANIDGSVVCHLGEVDLKKKAKGDILKKLYYEN